MQGVHILLSQQSRFFLPKYIFGSVYFHYRWLPENFAFGGKYEAKTTVCLNFNTTVTQWDTGFTLIFDATIAGIVQNSRAYLVARQGMTPAIILPE